MRREHQGPVGAGSEGAHQQDSDDPEDDRTGPGGDRRAVVGFAAALQAGIWRGEVLVKKEARLRPGIGLVRIPLPKGGLAV